MNFYQKIILLTFASFLSGCFSKDITGTYIDDSLNSYTFNEDGTFVGHIPFMGQKSFTYRVDDDEDMIKTYVPGDIGGPQFKIKSNGTLEMAVFGTILSKVEETGTGSLVKYDELGFRNYRVGQTLGETQIKLYMSQGFKEDIGRTYVFAKNSEYGAKPQKIIGFSRAGKDFENYNGIQVGRVIISSYTNKNLIEAIDLGFTGDHYSKIKNFIEKKFGTCVQIDKRIYKFEEHCRTKSKGGGGIELILHEEKKFTRLVFQNDELFSLRDQRFMEQLAEIGN